MQLEIDLFSPHISAYHLGPCGLFVRDEKLKLQLHDTILSATILFKLVDSYRIALKFAQ